MALVSSNILFIPRDKFAALLADAPTLAMNLLADLSRRLREFTLQVEALSLKEVPARLAAYILTLSAEQDNETQVQLPVSKAQLANLIGTTPETVSRVFTKMTHAGLIQVKGKEIRMRDTLGLSELADSGHL